mgnify:CR=1 FL=1
MGEIEILSRDEAAAFAEVWYDIAGDDQHDAIRARQHRSRHEVAAEGVLRVSAGQVVAGVEFHAVTQGEAVLLAALAFLPLGGTGEIGMNLNLYRCRTGAAERWLAVDCGIGFGGAAHPEVEVMMPDPDFIAETNKIGLEINRVGGDEVQKLVDALFATPKPVVERAQKILAN